MALPVLVGPNRCELIYNYDKQPLLELSLRISLPVRELLHMLSQHAPPATTPADKVQRSSTQGPPRGSERKTQRAHSQTNQTNQPTGPFQLPQGSCSSDWQPSPIPQDPWGHYSPVTWEPYPVQTEEWPGDWAPNSPQVEEQAQLLWALSDRAGPRYRKPAPTPSKPAAPAKKRLERAEQITLPPRAGNNSPGPTADIHPTVRTPASADSGVNVELQIQEGGDREFEPPPRSGAHPKKCPVQ